jgi:hypothetical protein
MDVSVVVFPTSKAVPIEILSPGDSAISTVQGALGLRTLPFVLVLVKYCMGSIVPTNAIDRPGGRRAGHRFNGDRISRVPRPVDTLFGRPGWRG